MEIDLLYIPDCRNRTVARHNLDRALTRAQCTAVIRERQVHSPEDAARLGMRGSPTILIRGRDPFAAGPGFAALSCRLYQTEAGHRGAPTVEQLVEALQG